MAKMVLAMCFVAVAIGAIVYYLQTMGRRAKGLPPGPPTKPLIGNLLQMPQKSPQYIFTEWAKTYGGIFTLKLGPANVVVITDGRLVKQLFDQRGSTYNDRPRSYIFQDLITEDNHMLFMQYGDKWRRFRKLVQRELSEPRVEKDHLSLLHAEADQMLLDLMTDPDSLILHTKRFSNSIIMSIVFGIRTVNAHVSHMHDLYAIMERWTEITAVNNTPPVDMLPILKWLPDSLFNHWRSRSRYIKALMSNLYTRLVRRVRARRQIGLKRGSFVDQLLDIDSHPGLSEGEIRSIGGMLIEGGSDTTSSVILTCILALAKTPRIQRKAHELLDEELGSSRSPRWEDYARLPYIAQIVKETMRWRPIAPLAIPHATNADDNVDGYVIPRGTTVIINIWGLNHLSRDPREPDPSIFDPDRFEKRTLLASHYATSSDYPSRDHYSYGAGRRLCPGIHLAERTLFIAIAKLLWAFEFREKADAPIDDDPNTGFSQGSIITPNPFECEVVLRASKEARQATIIAEYEEASSDVFGKYEV